MKAAFRKPKAESRKRRTLNTFRFPLSAFRFCQSPVPSP